MAQKADILKDMLETKKDFQDSLPGLQKCVIFYMYKYAGDLV